jgi:hypothetical protein
VTSGDADWDQRIAALWPAVDDFEPADFRARVEALAAELPEGDGIGRFEVASANDSPAGRKTPLRSTARRSLPA